SLTPASLALVLGVDLLRLILIAGIPGCLYRTRKCDSLAHLASAETCSESPRVEIEAVATAKIPAAAEVKADAAVSPFVHNELDAQEIERRRALVRMLFNDFWRGEDQKPASFRA